MQQQVELQQPAEAGAAAAAAAAAGNGVQAGGVPGSGSIPTTDLGRAQLLHLASNAAAEKSYQAGSGPLQFVTEACGSLQAGCFTVLDKLPTNISQLTGKLVEGTADSFRKWAALGFHNSAAACPGNPKFLRSQPTRHPYSMLVDGQHTEVMVGTAYDTAGIQKPKPLADGLWLSSCKFVCRISTKSATGRNELFAKVHVIRHLVLRLRDPSNRHGAPYWREWQQPRMQRTWELGCVALYEFPGELLKPVPAKLHPPANPVAVAPTPQAVVAAAPAVMQSPAGPAANAQLPSVAGQLAGAMMLQLPSIQYPGQGVLGVPAASLLQQPRLPLQPHVVQPPRWAPPANAADPASVGMAAAAAGGMPPLVPNTATALCRPGQAEFVGEDDPAAIHDLLADWLADDDHVAVSDDPATLLSLPALLPLAPAAAAPALAALVGPAAAAAAAAALAVAPATGTVLPRTILLDEPPPLVPIDEAQAQEASGNEDTDSLPDLTAPCGTVPNPDRLLLTLQDAEAEVQHRLLKLAAGMHGDNSGAVLAELLPRLELCNRERQLAGRSLLIADTAEYWFLQRSVLHLLVSKVHVWGPGGDEKPQGLSDACRLQLLNGLCGEGRTLKLLLMCGNRNMATPLFTAAHFCILPALEWLVSRPELTFPRMVQYTKRGKLPWHIISTQAHIAQKEGRPEEWARLQQGMVVVLTALARAAGVWVLKRTPERRQAEKRRVLDRADQRRMQRQQRQRSRLLAEAAAGGQHAGSPATPADAGVCVPTAAAATVAGLGAAAPASTSAAAVATSTQQQQQQQQQQGVSAASLPVAAGSSSSIASPGRLDLSDEVRWWLQNYAVFHTEWHSSRAASPPYNGDLLEDMVLALYGFRPRGVHE